MFKNNSVSTFTNFSFNNNNSSGGSGGGSPGSPGSGNYNVPSKLLILIPAVNYNSSSCHCIVLEPEVFDILGKIPRDCNNAYSI